MSDDKTSQLPPAQNNSKLVGWHVDVSVYRALKLLAAKTGKPNGAILSEAFAYILERNGEPVPEALTRDIDDYQRNGRRRRIRKR